MSPSSKSEFALRRGQHAEGAVGMEHSSGALCVLLVSAIERTRSRRPPKRFKPDDAWVQNSKALASTKPTPIHFRKRGSPGPGKRSIQR